MKYKIVARKGLVGFYMPGGGRMLHDLMPVKIARSIIQSGKIKISDKIKGFPVCVDEKYYFEAVKEV